MAKGDLMERLQMGIQPGLKPMSAENATGPSPEIMQRLGVMPGRSEGPQIPNANPMTGNPGFGNDIKAGMMNPGGRIMPMQSGGMFVNGNNPIGTGQKKMLKYNA